MTERGLGRDATGQSLLKFWSCTDLEDDAEGFELLLRLVGLLMNKKSSKLLVAGWSVSLPIARSICREKLGLKCTMCK